MAVRYKNFDLELDWSGDADAGIGEVTLTHPGTPPQRVNYDSTHDLVYPLVFSPQSFEEAQFHEDAGRHLTDLFFEAETPLGDEFRRTLRTYRRVRMRLSYPTDKEKAEALLRIPWEYLYVDDPASELKLNGFLCCKAGFSLAHCLPEAKPRTKSHVENLPVRLALLYSTSLEEDLGQPERIFEDVSKDLKQRDSASIIVLETFLKADESDVNTKLEHNDLVQILSHGKETAIGPVGGAITSTELKNFQDFLQGGQHRLRAIVLCACKSALDPLGVAATLHKTGVPVVIGITQRIGAETARLFMKALYSELAEGVYNLEQVLAFGRLHLRQSNWSEQDKLSLEWGLPRLYLAGRSSHIVSDRHLYRPLLNLFQKFKEMISKRLAKLRNQRIEPPDTLQEQIQAWIDGREEVLYITGPSGNGKSTEIARLLDANPHLVCHICAEAGKGDDLTNDPLAFSRYSLFSQLEAFYGERVFRSCLGKGVYPVTARDPHRAFFDLVVSPLQKAYKETGKRPIIVVEGLDNAVESSPSCSILDLLAGRRFELTQVARLIVTADSDVKDIHNRIRTELQPDREIPLKPVGEAQVWTGLKTDDRFNAFLSTTSLPLPDWLRQPLTDQQAQRLARRVDAEGLLTDAEELRTEIEGLLTGEDMEAGTDQERQLSPDVKPALLKLAKQTGVEELLIEEMKWPAWLQRPIPHQARRFVTRVVEDFTARDSVAMTEGLLNTLLKRLHQLAATYHEQNDPSANLRNYYQAYLDFVLAWNKERAEQIEGLLEALAAAYEPLPLDMLGRLIHLPPDQVDDLIGQVASFVEAMEQGFACEHPTIRRFLRDALPVDEAHGLFIGLARQELGEDEWGSVADWSKLDDYMQRHLVAHAYEHYRNADWQGPARHQLGADFLALVTAPGFRAFRLDREGLAVALQDVRQALQVAFTEIMLPADIQSPQALDAVRHLLVAFSAYDNPALISLEQKLRLENGGLPALLEFLGLVTSLPAS
jgi:hypothetical protein